MPNLQKKMISKLMSYMCKYALQGWDQTSPDTWKVLRPQSKGHFNFSFFIFTKRYFFLLSSEKVEKREGEGAGEGKGKGEAEINCLHPVCTLTGGGIHRNPSACCDRKGTSYLQVHGMML